MAEPHEVIADTIEVERYELLQAPLYRFDQSRRSFLKLMGAGMAILLVAQDVLAQESGSGGPPTSIDTDRIGAWLHIGPEGAVTVCTGKVEVGQNIRTSLAQAVADELHLALDGIAMIMGDTDLVPFDRGTFGSLSTPAMAPQLRRAGAAAREWLLDLGAESLAVERTALQTIDGRVVHARSGRSLGYGELTEGRQLSRTIDASTVLTATGQWTVAGRSAPKVNGRDFVTGTHRYPSDITRPGLLVGRVLRPPSFGAELITLDDGQARGLPGVAVVRDGNFVGVTAPSEPMADRALAALSAEWRQQASPVSAATLFEHLRATAVSDHLYADEGDVDTALASATHVHAQTYNIDFIAHTPLEPRAAVAEWSAGAVTVWTGTQRPFGVRAELSRAFDLPEEQVRVIMPDAGSGYGGKHTGEAAIEAARLAQATGHPVRVVWTRAEEFTWAYFRPGGVIDIRSGTDAGGSLVAWEHRNINSGGSGIRMGYNVPNQRIEFLRADSPLRQGSYRGLASVANIFARETHMDELAHLRGEDPLAFRLRHLADDRMAAVFAAAAERLGWASRHKIAGRGFGIAGGTEKGGYVATCAEVEVDGTTGKVRVVRAVAAFECGAIVNPLQLRNQIEGSMVQGLGGALFERIGFAQGRIDTASFARYRVPRFSDVPELDVVLVDRPDLPSAGAGETPICGIAPAIGNAIFDATGIRLRSLPLAPRGLKV